MYFNITSSAETHEAWIFKSKCIHTKEHEKVSQAFFGNRLKTGNRLCMCVCLQQLEWGVKSAELRAVRAVEIECTGEWSYEAGGWRASQKARDGWPHVATGELKVLVDDLHELLLHISSLHTNWGQHGRTPSSPLRNKEMRTSSAWGWNSQFPSWFMFQLSSTVRSFGQWLNKWDLYCQDHFHP